MGFESRSLLLPTAWLLASAFFLSACAPLPETRLKDPDRLGTVYRGMTRAEFLRVMGTEVMYVYRPDGHIRQIVPNPFLTETLSKGEFSYEIITYFVNPRPKEGPVTRDELIPTVFFDGKRVGSGWEFLEELRRPAPEPAQSEPAP